MKNKRIPIEKSMDILRFNLKYIARVNEWAEAIGYGSEKKFRRDFIQYFKISPGKVIKGMLLLSIIKCLENERDISCNEIAWRHGMRDHNELNSFVRYHTNRSPSDIKNMDQQNLDILKSAMIKNFPLDHVAIHLLQTNTVPLVNPQSYRSDNKNIDSPPLILKNLWVKFQGEIHGKNFQLTAFSFFITLKQPVKGKRDL